MAGLEVLPTWDELPPLDPDEPDDDPVPVHSLRSLPSQASSLVERIVDFIDPHTEADPWAVHLTFLAAFGSAVGRQPHVMVGADRHGTNLFAALVGRSSKARKGASLSPVRAIFEDADPDWARYRIVSGLGSGEGLVSAIRDESEQDGKVVDPGERDKRAFVMATELAGIFRVMSRQGSTLSPVLRDAWDSRDLRITTKHAPMRATDPHVSLLAHITEDELRRELTASEALNGFGNRLLWLRVGRSKLLPEPPPFGASPGYDELVDELRATLDEARGRWRMTRDEQARDLWAEVYPVLSRDRFGLAGSLLDRGEAQVLRLSLVYALADRAAAIGERHLRAALAMWERAERSVNALFGEATGDPVADRIEAELETKTSMTKTAISAIFGRHVSAARLDTALGTLVALGRVRRVTEPSGGRPAEVYMTCERSEVSE